MIAREDLDQDRTPIDSMTDKEAALLEILSKLDKYQKNQIIDLIKRGYGCLWSWGPNLSIGSKMGTPYTAFYNVEISAVPIAINGVTEETLNEVILFMDLMGD